MEHSVVFAGFGGQGVLFAGQLLAHAAADAGLHVTWIPSYGPEMRGGTANCTVVLGDEPIGSPLVRHPDGVVAMNLPSTDKYESLVKSGGVFIVNGSLVKRPSRREDIDVIVVPANEMAEELGSQRMANVVMLGALLASRDLLSLEAMEDALRRYLPERHAHLLEANIRALHAGAAFARERMLAPA
ncbi:MAG TPA: 2-oxoacid:ferredoxin oxidoreductase subunit gamma [Anaerolineae bacterium]|nr:2-oxoacid:ferredoxin oxidoreductase subunit gamma [Anaerolineae bacterium]HIQ12550.1 2-oxoacid:ferredoxin oxidoreductase subunit gamma [Caldilineales bacterium]